MKKPNWNRFVWSLYSWTVHYTKYGSLSCYVEKRSGQSRAVNIGGNQVLNRIYEMKFSQLNEARDLIRKAGKDYRLYVEKII